MKNYSFLPPPPVSSTYPPYHTITPSILDILFMLPSHHHPTKVSNQRRGNWILSSNAIQIVTRKKSPFRFSFHLSQETLDDFHSRYIRQKAILSKHFPYFYFSEQIPLDILSKKERRKNDVTKNVNCTNQV